ANTQMMELYLSLSPRQGNRAFEGRRIVVLIRQVERFIARRRDDRPECDPHRPPRRNAYASAKTEDRIEHGADGIGERPAVEHGDRRPDLPPTPEEASPVGLELHAADGLAFRDGKV